jgi:DNA-binding SARP family transcriptional activator
MRPPSDLLHLVAERSRGTAAPSPLLSRAGSFEPDEPAPRQDRAVIDQHFSVVVGSTVRIGRQDGSVFEVSGKSAVVIAMVAMEGSVERGRLADMIWPRSREHQTRANLRTLVHRLNQRAGADLLVGVDHLRLNPDRTTVQWQDQQGVMEELERRGADGWQLLAHAGLDLAGSEPLELWLSSARRRIRGKLLASWCQTLATAQARGDMLQAVTLARACVQMEPLSEHWHRQLMDALARSGDRAAALAAYEACKSLLREHLGVGPDPQTQRLHRELLQA